MKGFTVTETGVGRWGWRKERGGSLAPLFSLPGNERTNVEERFTNDGRGERTW